MIEIKNIIKKYGEKTIFNKVNFTFSDTGLVCLLGASGCGKSTLLNMLAGFDSDYSGEIIVHDISISKMSPTDLCSYRRNTIGFVFQNYNLLAGYTVLENILLSYELNNYNNLKAKEKAKALLKQFDMTDKENEKVENLSGGQKQRVAIARALIHSPSIILADEPTGALDRKNSNEIMELLKDLSKECLVLVITHDQKICEFADQIISIKEDKIIGNESTHISSSKLKQKQKITFKVSSFRHGYKNFKVHLTRYVAISLAISIGIFAFMLSLSSHNIIDKSIVDFKEKNTAFSNGYVKVEDNEDKILSLLKDDKRVENVYQQYMIENVVLSIGEKNESMAEKYPMPKATETMSYGVMPKSGEKKIVLSPSLAKKFQNDINNLINQELVLKIGKTEYKLTISGIFNAGYDDFFASSDIEQKFYNHINQKKPYSISYDVKNFEDIVSVSQVFVEEGLEAKTAAKEVTVLQNTFEKLNSLFLVVSVLVLSIGLFISIILLVKLQNSRYREIGLLSALGFSQKQISKMIVSENIFLSLVSAVFNAILIGGTYLVSQTLKLDLIIMPLQIVMSIFVTGIAVILISFFATYKLIHTEPSVALRK